MSRSKKGAQLPTDDQDFVLTQMKPVSEPAREYLLQHRFKVTKFGRADRRCRAPVGVIDPHRKELVQVRALARAIVTEMKKVKAA